MGLTSLTPALSGNFLSDLGYTCIVHPLINCMKRCPECRRDYYDDTLLYCLEDGTSLVQGSVPPPDEIKGEPVASAGGQIGEEPQTAILHSTAAPGEAPTRAQIHTTEKTAVLPGGAEAEPRESLGGLPERQSLSANRAGSRGLVR